MRRVVTSYKLMLDFYGMRLEDETTGLISRSSNYASQYRNLCSTFFCPDTILQSGLRSWLGRYFFPYALREPLRSRNLILSVRLLCMSSDELIVEPFRRCPSITVPCDRIPRLPLLFVPSTGSSHNNLRISRILKCLSEFGYEYLNYGFVLHVLNEQSEHGQLNTSIIRSSMDCWWANCVRRQQERDWINEKIARARDKGADEPFVFTREMYEAAISNWKNEGRF